ncbi:hypothetical protein CkaCkLH20_04721 [Colletotrichum karsti]|uniref:AB hydrolase-1 domain-containing protein n=1 Tax=Colletotrichum karsti TaxID=1095194 RepID=A0A9P6I9F1_9PEZI|nr:uncharacterized protein CkaCkLH20_04721 [Colletotrichum karsti]KAF9877586.1 hypothetical protein CkaCkLH20_04721 [Colletotrichum karsti]
MGFLDFCFSYEWLYWTAPTGEPPAAPKGLTRHWVETPSGRIEVLSNQGANPSTSKTPIVFVHGGMGSAWVWTEYMRYLAKNDIPSYAVSLRGHGNSWHPSYLRMVYLTTRQDLADDALAVIWWVQERHGSEVLLVGHSSGGGLCQGILSARQAHAKGLALLGAVPCSGSSRVYANWAALDPWFLARMILQFWHPNSPLSHPFLVNQAFFGDEMTEAGVLDFMKHANRYESFLWPFSMMLPFAKPASIVNSIGGWGSGERILVMAGTQDKLMTHGVTSNLARTLRTAFAELVGSNKLDAQADEVKPLAGEGDKDDDGDWVRLAWVPGAGHHLQNDVMWEIGANKLLEFYEQL